MNLALATGPLAQAIGWALLHLVWQGALVAALLALVLIRRWRLVVYLLLLLLVGVLAIMARPGRVTPTTSTTASASGN